MAKENPSVGRHDGGTSADRRFEELETIYRTAPVGLGLVDRDLRYVRVNDRLAEFIGRPREEIIGQSLEQAIPAAASKIEPYYRRVLESGEPLLELEITAPTEAEPEVERHWLVSYSPVVSEKGAVVGVSSIIQDVTEKTEALRALWRSEEQFRAFMDHSPNHIYMKAADGRHLFANRTLLELFQMDPEAFRGTRTADFFPPEVAVRVEEGDRECLEGSARVEVLDITTTKSGERIWVHDLKFPVRDVSGGLIVGGIATDITALKEAEADLEEKASFEALLSRLSASFVNLPLELIDDTLTHALEEVGRFLNLDRCAYGNLTENQREVVVTHVWNRLQEEPTGKRYPLADHQWLASPFVSGVPVFWSKDLDVPDEARSEIEVIEQWGFLRFAGIPVTISGSIAGALAFSSSTNPGPWKPAASERLDLLARVFGNVLARRKADLELQTALAENEDLRRRLEAENLYLREHAELRHEHREIIGQSEAIKGALHEAEQVAPTDSTVLLLGETGTGKELLANAVHRLSNRSSKPLVHVNCAALPSALIEAELFGREKGAYTGALSRQIGRFEIADGSTIFLDEIGELALDLQVKLLRVLQQGQFERLGSTRTISVDVRVIAATNRDLSKGIAEGRFREDLFYRLNVFPITVPPLRDRREDIPSLVWAFLQEFAAAQGKTIDTVSKRAMESLQRYRWLGNVRELRNVVERAVILSRGPNLELSVPEPVGATGPGALTMAALQRHHIVEVMERTGWRVRGAGGAAEILGMKPTTLDNRMKKLGILRPDTR